MKHEVYALRYTQDTGTRSGMFHCHHVYGEDDAPQDVDFAFWLVRAPGSTLLVDCGFDSTRSGRRGRKQDTDPLVLLERMGVTPEQVDRIVISHMHYDHVGNLDLFPDARIVIAREELDYWTDPAALDRRLNSQVVDAEDVASLRRRRDAGMVDVIDGTGEVVPGVTVAVVGGHTPGQVVVDVETPTGTVVLATDAAHFEEEYVASRPFALFHDLDALYACYDVLERRAAEPGVTIVPGHDPLTATQFVEVEENCFDLTAAVD